MMPFCRYSGKRSFPRWGLAIIIAIWCLASSGWAQGTNFYHTNRVFHPVTFTIPGVPTAFEVCDMAGKLTTVVGPTNVVTNSSSYVATEYQGVVVGYASPTQAWAAAAGAYPSNSITHSNSFYDNVGWVKGVKQTWDGKWGAYIWLLQNTVNFKPAPTNVWVSTNGVTNAIFKVLVGTIGDYLAMATNQIDTGPSLAGLTNWPTAGGLSNDVKYKADFTAYYDIGLPALWIQPMLTNVCINSGNVTFSLVTNNYVTNVNWSITPTNGLTNGAVLTGYATSAVVEVGGVATSYVVKATANTNIFGLAVLNVVMAGSPLQYNIGTNGWADMPDPLYVGSNTTVNFKAMKVPVAASWPGGKPAWGGLLSGSGVETNSYTFNVVSSSTTDYQIVNAECGNTVTGKVVVCMINSETVATIPTNQTRTQIGVGEEVNLWLIPSDMSAMWSTTAGSVNPSNGNATLFTAPSLAVTGSVTITATYSNSPFCTIGFSVIPPAGYIVPIITSITGYGVNVARAGMTNDLWLLPTNVSFYRVQIMEVGAVSTNATGYFANTNVWPTSNLDHGQHGAGHWVPLTEGQGINMDNHVGTDTADSGVCPPLWSTGHFTWPIPAVWRLVYGTTSNSFPWSDQNFTIDASGTVTVQKFGHTVTRTTNDVYTTSQ